MNISISKLDPIGYNPPERESTKELANLRKGIAATGGIIVNDIIVVKDRETGRCLVADGHRRLCIAKELKKTSMGCKVFYAPPGLTTQSYADEIYSILNGTAGTKRHHGYDIIYLWLCARDGCPPEHKPRVQRMFNVVGRDVLFEMVKHKATSEVYYQSRVVLDYCAQEFNTENMTRVIRWMLKWDTCYACRRFVREKKNKGYALWHDYILADRPLKSPTKSKSIRLSKPKNTPITMVDGGLEATG